MERQTIEALELDGTAQSDRSVRHSQQSTSRSDANGIDRSNSGKQRIDRALHEQSLRSTRSLWRISSKTKKIISFSTASLQVVNDHLLKDLTELGLWNPDMKNRLMYENGSIQVRLPLSLRAMFASDSSLPAEHRNDSRSHQGAVQNGLGNLSEDDYQHGG